MAAKENLRKIKEPKSGGKKKPLSKGKGKMAQMIEDIETALKKADDPQNPT